MGLGLGLECVGLGHALEAPSLESKYQWYFAANTTVF